MSLFKVIARALSTVDNTLAIAENITAAGAKASESSITLAENFDLEQKAKLKAKQEQINKDIQAGKFDL